MQVRAHHWACVVAAALCLHAAVAAAVLWTPARPGARQVGGGGIDVSLGPAGGVAGDAAADAPPPAEVEEVEPVETDGRPVEPVQPEVLVVRPPEPQEVVPVETVKAVEPVVERQVKTPPPPKARPRPPEAKQPEPPKIEPARVEPPRAEIEPAPQVAAKTPSVAGTEGKAGTQVAPRAGSGDNSAGGGSAGAAADYMSLLQAWLEKHKEYPRSARLRRQEGTVLLYFAINAAGEVLAHRIERSSGHGLLDEEAMAMIRRATPVPPLPEDMNRERLEVVVPVQFLLR